MPVANQYGIDMGNILSTVSDLKTAQQNRETNALQKDMLSRQNTKEIATDQAEQDYLKDPKTAAAQTIAQKMQWNKLGDEEKVRAATAMKQHINQRGITLNSVIGIQDPSAQKEALLKAVSTLTPEEQQGMSKYGSSVEEWQQNLPRMMNDLLVSDGGVDMLQKQAEAKTKHEGDLELWGVKGANALAVAGQKGDTSIKVQAMKGETAKEIAEKRSKNALLVAKFKSEHGGNPAKMTEGQRNVLAVMSANPGMTPEQARFALLQGQRVTNVDDPIYGKKTITSSKTLPNKLKAPPPMVKKNLPPLNINKYTK